MTRPHQSSHFASANEPVYCRLCGDTGRVRGLDEDLKTTIDPCVLCHPERLLTALTTSTLHTALNQKVDR